MRILIDIGHPAHVHYFKNFINIIEKKGGKCIVTSRDKEIALELLQNESISYISRGGGAEGSISKAVYMLKATRLLSKIVQKQKPDIAVSFGSPYLAQAAYWNGIPHIAFGDTEHASISHKFCWPFSNSVLTPSCYRKKI